MSKIEVNQISSQCGSTLTIGQSGDTVTLASGATQTGFGRTGTVDWCTTAKTAPFTGVSGKGYFVNTTCGAVTVTLPATPTAGDIISIKDYARTAGTNNINFCRNGSKMDGVCANSGISTNGESTTLIYVDGTKGWTSILDNTTAQYGATYITATGGTITCCGNYKIHTFTSDGCFSVSAGAGPLAKVDYLVVAGGGSGGDFIGAGAGAGGFRVSNGLGIPTPTMSPLSACVASLPVSIQTYPITVGAGAAFSPGPCTSDYPSRKGSDSVFSTITSTGGGGGGFFPGVPSPVGGVGGSGGGSDYNCSPPASPAPGGAGNTPPVSPPQGNPGGYGVSWPGALQAAPGGGGGAGAAGSPSPGAGTVGNGGIGSFVAPTFAGSNGTTGPVPDVRYFAGGGGGGGYTSSGGGTGGSGGGGTGATSPNNPPTLNGVANTGGGGGGQGGYPAPGPAGGAGGSGIVIIRYKFQ